MEIKILDKNKFYPIYLDWSEHYGFPARHLEEIDTMIGCYKGDILVYTCFFWGTNSTFCVIGFPFASPYTDKKTREGCLQGLFEGISRMAKDAGFKLIWTTSSTPPVEKALTGSGFQSGDQRVNQYIKVLH